MGPWMLPDAIAPNSKTIISGHVEIGASYKLRHVISSIKIHSSKRSTRSREVLRVNALTPGQNSRHFADDVWNLVSCMRIVVFLFNLLKFVPRVHESWNLFPLIQLTMRQCFEYLLGTKHAISHSLKRKSLHFDEMFITGCTGSCQNDNFQCSQWWKFRQNDDIFVSVLHEPMTA